MGIEPYVTVVKNCFAIAKDGRFIAVDPKSGQLFMDPYTIPPNKMPKPFQSLVWSHPVHNMGNIS